MRKIIVGAALFAVAVGAGAMAGRAPQDGARLEALQANAPAGWDLRQIGSGLECRIAAESERSNARVRPESSCRSIHPALATATAVDARAGRIAFVRDDGSVTLEFLPDDGGVFEAVDDGAMPILLSQAE